MDLRILPHVNAALNATSAVLIVAGFVLVKRGRKEAHRACMQGALAASALFLASYLVYHFSSGATKFRGEGWVRPAYFALLGSHTVLAVVAFPLVLATWREARLGRFDRHRGLARVTFPIWLYVSLTGVAVYAMLYHLYPAPPLG